MLWNKNKVINAGIYKIQKHFRMKLSELKLDYKVIKAFKLECLFVAEFDPKILTSAASASSTNKKRAVQMVLPMLIGLYGLMLMVFMKN